MSGSGGKREGAGRPLGSKDKHTTAFKDLLTQVYTALEEKEDAGLQVWAEKNPNDFYKICAKLIPTQIGIDLPEGKSFSLKIE